MYNNSLIVIFILAQLFITPLYSKTYQLRHNNMWPDRALISDLFLTINNESSLSYFGLQNKAIYQPNVGIPSDILSIGGGYRWFTSNHSIIGTYIFLDTGLDISLNPKPSLSPLLTKLINKEDMPFEDKEKLQESLLENAKHVTLFQKINIGFEWSLAPFHFTTNGYLPIAAPLSNIRKQYEENAKLEGGYFESKFKKSSSEEKEGYRTLFKSLFCERAFYYSGNQRLQHNYIEEDSYGLDFKLAYSIFPHIISSGGFYFFWDSYHNYVFGNLLGIEAYFSDISFNLKHYLDWPRGSIFSAVTKLHPQYENLRRWTADLKYTYDFQQGNSFTADIKFQFTRRLFIGYSRNYNPRGYDYTIPPSFYFSYHFDNHDRNNMQPTHVLWRPIERHNSPLMLRNTRTVRAPIYFLNASVATSEIDFSKRNFATFEAPSKLLTQAMVDHAPEKASFYFDGEQHYDLSEIKYLKAKQILAGRSSQYALPAQLKVDGFSIDERPILSFNSLQLKDENHLENVHLLFQETPTKANSLFLSAEPTDTGRASYEQSAAIILNDAKQVKIRDSKLIKLNQLKNHEISALFSTYNSSLYVTNSKIGIRNENKTSSGAQLHLITTHGGTDLHFEDTSILLSTASAKDKLIPFIYSDKERKLFELNQVNLQVEQPSHSPGYSRTIASLKDQIKSQFPKPDLKQNLEVLKNKVTLEAFINSNGDRWNKYYPKKPHSNDREKPSSAEEIKKAYQFFANELDSSPEKIKGMGIKEFDKCYKKLSLKYHPDKNPLHNLTATTKFQELNGFYQTISKEKNKAS
jgi:hypothetical protein